MCPALEPAAMIIYIDYSHLHHNILDFMLFLHLFSSFEEFQHPLNLSVESGVIDDINEPLGTEEIAYTGSALTNFDFLFSPHKQRTLHRRAQCRPWWAAGLLTRGELATSAQSPTSDSYVFSKKK